MRLEVIDELTKNDKPISVFEYKNKRKFIKLNDSDLDVDYRNLTGDQLKELIFSQKNKNKVSNIINNLKLSAKFLSPNGKSIDINNKSMMFLPDFSKERELIYIFAPSGAGKSYLTRKFVEEFKKVRPDYDIFLFSRINDDPSLEGINFTHIKMEEDVLRDIDVSSLENSVVIFDDTETNDKAVDKLILALKDLIAMEGRHYNITMIITTHMACNYNRTRIILNECQKYVIFPKSNGVKQMENMFCKYGGLSKKQFEDVRRLDTRWCMLNTAYPNYLIHEKGVLLLG